MKWADANEVRKALEKYVKKEEAPTKVAKPIQQQAAKQVDAVVRTHFRAHA